MKSALTHYNHPNPSVIDEHGDRFLVLRLTPYGDDEYTNFCRMVAKKFAHDAYYKDGQLKQFGSEVEASIMIIEDELRSKAGPSPRKEDAQKVDEQSGTADD